MDELERLCHGAEAARAAAHGRQAGREGAALHRAIPPAQRPLPAELRREHGRGADRRYCGRSRASKPSLPPAACGADAKPWAISTCWSPARMRRAALDRFVAYPRVEEVLGRGENKASAKVGREGLQVDVRALPPRQLRRRHAVLHRQQGPQRGHAHARREDGAEAQRVRPVPRRRTIRAWPARPKPASTRRWACRGFRRSCARTRAKSKPPPKAACPSWWNCADIRGDLHMHTTETDGRATLEEMAEAARERGYEYIAITDHSKALAMANGLDEKRVVEFAAPGARDQPRRRSASASSPASSATS